jgi:DNA-binding CsgD family transcriptional regulator
LLCVIREIEDAKNTLTALYNKKSKIEDAEQANRRKAEKVTKTDKHRLGVKMMQMASSGMSLSKIAEELGVSKNTMDVKISRAWAKEFPAHHAANLGKIIQLGLLTALRDSPPLFIYSHNALNSRFNHVNTNQHRK